MKHIISDRAKSLERRRFEAAKFFKQGKSQVWIAKHYGVSRVSAHYWYWAWKKQGPSGLKAQGKSGAPPKLTKKHLVRIEKVLLKGPRAEGYDNDLWTLPRIGKVIKTISKVTYHPGHVWKILKALGWTRQKPETRARERNEEKIEQWKKERFPALQKKGSKQELCWVSSMKQE